MPLRSSLAIAFLTAALVSAALGGPAGALSRAAFPALSLGSRGIDVVAAQHLLRARGHAVPVDGLFRSGTQAATADFQEAAGLRVTGAINGPTWEALVPTLAAGAGGDAVAALQKLLKRKRGAGLTVNSSFDGATRQAVRQFQSHMGLSVTGVVNLGTWRHLVWHYARPAFGAATGLCNYNGGNAGADWGTGATVAMIEAAGALFTRRTGGRIAIGDVSWEHGGEIVLHATHEIGLDVDIALVRRDGAQCNRPGIGYRSAQYDRGATRQLIKAIYDAAPHHVKLIYFNDPVLIGEGLVQRYPNHDDHLHVRYCEAGHPQARYHCALPALDAQSSGAPLEPALEPSVDPSAEPWLDPSRLQWPGRSVDGLPVTDPSGPVFLGRARPARPPGGRIPTGPMSEAA